MELYVSKHMVAEILCLLVLFLREVSTNHRGLLNSNTTIPTLPHRLHKLWLRWDSTVVIAKVVGKLSILKIY